MTRQSSFTNHVNRDELPLSSASASRSGFPGLHMITVSVGSSKKLIVDAFRQRAWAHSFPVGWMQSEFSSNQNGHRLGGATVNLVCGDSPNTSLQQGHERLQVYHPYRQGLA